MHSSPVPIGKRPELKQSGSAGWSWPRLIPIHEQQSHSSTASQSSPPFPLHDHIEQEKPPTTMISTTKSRVHVEEDTPQSPVLSPTDSPPTAGGSVAGTVKHQTYEHPRNTFSWMGDSDDEGRTAAGLYSRSVKDVDERKDSSPESGSVEDVVERGASASSASGCRPIEDTVQQGGIETPVGYENRSTCLAKECDVLSECANWSLVTNSH